MLSFSSLAMSVACEQKLVPIFAPARSSTFYLVRNSVHKRAIRQTRLLPKSIPSLLMVAMSYHILTLETIQAATSLLPPTGRAHRGYPSSESARGHAASFLSRRSPAAYDRVAVGGAHRAAGRGDHAIPSGHRFGPQGGDPHHQVQVVS